VKYYVAYALTFNLLRGIIHYDMEHLLSPSRRGFSVRSILAFVLIVFVTMVLWTLGGGSQVNAAGEATWSGETILYEEHGYSLTKDLKDTTNTIPDGATIYQAPVQTQGSNDKKALVLYFSPGVDPPTAETVKYIEFTIADNGDMTNAQNKLDVGLTPQSESGTLDSCNVNGIGWIICPLSIFIANGMDQVFIILSGLIEVQPSVLGDSNNGMYIAWNVMRNIANIAFVIAFLIIIYSQLSNFGVSNYGIKKLIPRLIIAAVLVNVSFIITAAAIDVSNVLGYSIQNVFNDIRENVFNLTDDNFGGVNDNPWTAVTALVLAGGGIIGGTFFAASGGLWMLIPLLVGLILTLVFVIIVLAARQAIIVILVIIAPIAFVANLLPNTEKWFDKWKDLFMTMLIFFPAFSLVFGGSQLAGQLIIQNAGDNIISVIFGMAVQIAPLVITPLLLKFSGSLLGRIAQIANNPSKGMLDRTKNWAGARGELSKQKNMAKGARWYNPASYGAAMVRSGDFRKRRLQDRTNAYKQQADNKYHESDKYSIIHSQMHGAELDKQRIESQNSKHIQKIANTRGTSLNLKTIQLEDAKVASEAMNESTAGMLSEYRAGGYNTMGDERLSQLQTNMAKNVLQTAGQKQRTQTAQLIQSQNVAGAMNGNVDGILDTAAGIGGEIAMTRAQSSATAVLMKAEQEARDNNKTLLTFEASRQGKRVVDYAKELSTSANQENSTVNADRLEAALQVQIEDGQTMAFEDMRKSRYIDQSLVDRVINRNSGTFKSKGGFHWQADMDLSLQRYIEKAQAGTLQDYNPETGAMEQVTTEQGAEAAFERELNRQKLISLSNTNADALGGMKYGTFLNTANNLESILESMDIRDGVDNPRATQDKAIVAKVHQTIRSALRDENTVNSMNDRIDEVHTIDKVLSGITHQDPLPLTKDEVITTGNQPERPRVGAEPRETPTDLDGNPSESVNEP
jgi:hypothetical protein